MKQRFTFLYRNQYTKILQSFPNCRKKEVFQFQWRENSKLNICLSSVKYRCVEFDFPTFNTNYAYMSSSVILNDDITMRMIMKNKSDILHKSLCRDLRHSRNLHETQFALFLVFGYHNYLQQLKNRVLWVNHLKNLRSLLIWHRLLVPATLWK